MSCDVCLYGIPDVDNEFFSTSTPRARKPHRCIECKATIPAGDKYERAAGKSDGAMFTETTCLLCAEIRDVFHCGSGYYFGALWQDMVDEAFPHLTTASECFRELSPPAKSFVLEKWQAWKGLPSSHLTPPRPL